MYNYTEHVPEVVHCITKTFQTHLKSLLLCIYIFTRKYKSNLFNLSRDYLKSYDFKTLKYFGMRDFVYVDFNNSIN